MKVTFDVVDTAEGLALALDHVHVIIERAVDGDAVRAVYGGALDAATILELNPNADVTGVLQTLVVLAPR